MLFSVADDNYTGSGMGGSERLRKEECIPITLRLALLVTTNVPDGAVVEQVESFKFLGVHTNNKLTWSKNTKTVVTKSIPPQETEKNWHGSSNPQKV